jgi:hypothetical protein
MEYKNTFPYLYLFVSDFGGGSTSTSTGGGLFGGGGTAAAKPGGLFSTPTTSSGFGAKTPGGKSAAG